MEPDKKRHITSKPLNVNDDLISGYLNGPLLLSVAAS